MSVSEKWGRTVVKNDKCSYTWTISNFSYLFSKTGEALESPSFTIGTGHRSTKWCLRLYPKGINEDFKDYLSVFLHRKAPAAELPQQLDGQYTLSILNEQREKFTEDKEAWSNKSFNSWGFPSFVRKDLVNDKANGLLVDDSVTLFCEITIITGLINLSSEETRTQGNVVVDRKSIRTGGYYDKFFLDEKFSDVKLVTRCGKELRAHKAILAAQSPIFAAMFEHEMMERKFNCVEITDVDHEVLKEMLRFLYTGKADNIEAIASELLAAADKYGIQELKDTCEHVLSNAMAVSNVVEVLVVSDRHNIADLKIRAMHFIKAHIREVIETPAFNSLVQPDILVEIIRASLL